MRRRAFLQGLAAALATTALYLSPIAQAATKVLERRVFAHAEHYSILYQATILHVSVPTNRESAVMHGAKRVQVPVILTDAHRFLDGDYAEDIAAGLAERRVWVEPWEVREAVEAALA